MTSTPNAPLTEALLTIADDKLMLGHRNSDWTGIAPILEEDIAFSSLAQDEMAHASAIYEFIAAMTDDDANRIAFGRSPDQYRCAQIVELPDEFDWATAIARQFFCDHFDRVRLNELAASSNDQLAALAKRLAAEEQIHVDHVDGWVQRLGRGTDEARDKLQHALDAIAPHACMLWEQVENQKSLLHDGSFPALGPDEFDHWAQELTSIAEASGVSLILQRPTEDVRGGRRGVHSEHFAALLDEMCEVYRLEPNSAW